ncbi:hypothetical protein AB205_0154570 [Aquarana catesbeiana]|uniref:Uncharacterized protein n=1 Tax=Aquarana catesbeiana TaxID=8400 RepID=A0A2G9SI43_AQUCT|nr:hypothetical protein AB205_0154570 [Aquarana catesbeiana]
MDSEVIECKQMQICLHLPAHRLTWSFSSDLPEILTGGSGQTTHVKGAYVWGKGGKENSFVCEIQFHKLSVIVLAIQKQGMSKETNQLLSVTLPQASSLSVCNNGEGQGSYYGLEAHCVNLFYLFFLAETPWT